MWSRTCCTSIPITAHSIPRYLQRLVEAKMLLWSQRFCFLSISTTFQCPEAQLLIAIATENHVQNHLWLFLEMNNSRKQSQWLGV